MLQAKCLLKAIIGKGVRVLAIIVVAVAAVLLVGEWSGYIYQGRMRWVSGAIEIAAGVLLIVSVVPVLRKRGY